MATINGTNGNDTKFGTANADVFNLLRGNDRGFGGGGNDRMDGGDGNDLLNGEAGNDTLVGGRGNDILRGSLGFDTLTGGAGKDTFGFVQSSSMLPQDDTITDFNRGQGDKIQLGSAKNSLFDFADDNGDGVISDADVNVSSVNGGEGVFILFDGAFGGTSAGLMVLSENELFLSDFIV